MADRMPRCIEEIEAPVAEEVQSSEPPQLQTVVVERDLPEFTPSIVGFEDWCRLVLREGWGEGVLEARANDEAGGARESGWVARVVPVVVTPDDALDFGRADTAVLEDLGNAFLDGERPAAAGDAVGYVRGEVFPVFADAERMEVCENCALQYHGIRAEEQSL